MKIKLSKSQWELVGKKAGWIKTALIPDDGIADGGEPYTNDEMDLMENKEQDGKISRRRTVRVTFNDGDSLVTEINGTVADIQKYYLSSGEQDYDMAHPEKTRKPVNVEFLK